MVLWGLREPMEDAMGDRRPLASVGCHSQGGWTMAPSCLNKQVLEDTGLFVLCLLRSLPRLLVLYQSFTCDSP